MGWLSSLMGMKQAQDAASHTVKTGVDMLEKAFFTDQEKHEFSIKLYDQWLDHQKVAATQSVPTAISRRIVAWGVLSLVWVAFIAGMILTIMEQSHKVDGIIWLLESVRLGWAFTAVIVFYFGPHTLQHLSVLMKKGG